MSIDNTTATEPETPAQPDPAPTTQRKWNDGTVALGDDEVW